jgi:hypothetical protein
MVSLSVARHPLGNLERWEAIRDRVHEALQEAVGDAKWEANDPDDLWREDKELRKKIRPVLADVGETAQFLATKHLRLTREAHDSFLDWLYDDLSAALTRLMRQVQGDFGDDGYSSRFPAFVRADGSETPKELFDAWVSGKPMPPLSV